MDGGPEAERSDRTAAAEATQRARLCPECGRLLRRYRLGHGLAFTVDRCGACAGVWCDTGEWELLRGAGIHSRLHHLFSDSWQARLKEREARERYEERVRSILGEVDLARAREFKLWLDAHPHRATLSAYLAGDVEEKPAFKGSEE